MCVEGVEVERRAGLYGPAGGVAHHHRTQGGVGKLVIDRLHAVAWSGVNAVVDPDFSLAGVEDGVGPDGSVEVALVVQ